MVAARLNRALQVNIIENRLLYIHINLIQMAKFDYGVKDLFRVYFSPWKRWRRFEFGYVFLYETDHCILPNKCTM